MPSPIDRMIDEATGFDRSQFVQLHCVECGRKQLADHDPTDPPGTFVVQARCPECVGGDFDEALYYDENGNQLMCD